MRSRIPGDGAPLISILISARNEAAAIAPTVGRILAQTYERFELLVLDDGSQDGTAEIARAVAGGDPRFLGLRGSKLETEYPTQLLSVT